MTEPPDFAVAGAGGSEGSPGAFTAPFRGLRRPSVLPQSSRVRRWARLAIGGLEMNRLSTEKRAQMLHMLVEGCSMRSVSRMVGEHQHRGQTAP